jgi:hypothetical protein
LFSGFCWFSFNVQIDTKRFLPILRQINMYISYLPYCPWHTYTTNLVHYIDYWIWFVPNLLFVPFLRSSML